MSISWSANQRKFIEWSATPRKHRKIKTQLEFADIIGVNENTLTRWKKKPGFQDAVTALARHYLGAALPDIYGAMIDEAVSGDVAAIKLAMEMAGEYTPTSKHQVSMEDEIERIKNMSDDELDRFIAGLVGDS